jgi:hypothetical protein
MRDRLTQIAREAGIFTLFLALTILMTWPLAPHLGEAVADRGDPYINSWIVSWVGRTLVSDPASLFDAPMFHPAHSALAFSENLIGISVLAIPMQLAGVPPLAVYNVLLLLGFAASGYGAFVLARKVTRSEPAAFVAGVFFAFVLFRFNHLSHLQHVWSASIPLLLAAVFHLVERTTWRSAALLAAALVWNAYANMHWLVFGSFAAALTLIVAAAFTGRLRDRDLAVKSAAAALVAGILIYPLKLPYESVRESYGMVRSLDEMRAYSADLAGWLTAPLRSIAYGHAMNDGSTNPETWLFPGFLAILLSVYALVTVRTAEGGRVAILPRVHPFVLRALDAGAAAGLVVWLLGVGAARPIRFLPEPSIAGPVTVLLIIIRLWLRMPSREGMAPRSLRSAVLASGVPLSIWCALLWVVVGVWGSLGSDGWLHSSLMAASESVVGIRAPARWAMIAYVGLAVFIAHAVADIARRLRHRFAQRRTAAIVSLAFALLFLYELRAAPIRWYLRPSREPDVYGWLAKAPLQGAVLELPVAHEGSDYRYLFHAASHGRRIVNGVSGHTPPAHQRLIAMSHADPIPPAFLERLRRIGCELVVVHVDHLGPYEERVRRWLADGLANGEIQPVGWFPHQLRGDYVVSVGTPAPSLLASAGSAQRRFSGRIAAMSTRFPLAPERPFALFHGPSTWRGAIRVDGWAAAPAGVRAVNLLFGNGSVSVSTKLVRRDDLVKAYPDFRYPQIVGFEVDFPKRPKGIRRDSNLQLEVVDANGVRARFETMFITWRSRGDIRGTEWDAEPLARLVSSLSLEPGRDVRRVVRGEITALRLAESSHLMDERLTDRAFVDGMFRAIVARAPDGGTRAMYLEDLRRGKPRRRLMQSLFRSREFELKHLTAAAEAEAWLK